ncbi:hypothetical protein M5X00_25915 [Paenibacillus alvei]|uniref:hypothetical protein n=1 Tax=Paenibacillus alvei TaxID=44250 RepID=UPI00227FD993|nr:hypothetical protein [Paenibacillus alvei]MCY9757667.1 hypothetical protein [Paenibacillus alvei]
MFLEKDIREHVNILIERWANGKLYVVKNRYSPYEQSIPYEIHPNEALKLMSQYDKVIIANWDITGKRRGSECAVCTK